MNLSVAPNVYTVCKYTYICIYAHAYIYVYTYRGRLVVVGVKEIGVDSYESTYIRTYTYT